MRPNSPGVYKAREIIYGFGGTVFVEPARAVQVVSSDEVGSNTRGQKLFVKTGYEPPFRPKYQSLDCFNWDV
jgi:hypothetical protein